MSKKTGKKIMKMKMDYRMNKVNHDKGCKRSLMGTWLIKRNSIELNLRSTRYSNSEIKPSCEWSAMMRLASWPKKDDLKIIWLLWVVIIWIWWPRSKIINQIIWMSSDRKERDTVGESLKIHSIYESWKKLFPFHCITKM